MRAREMVVEVAQPGAEEARPPGGESGEDGPDPGRRDPARAGARRAHGRGARGTRLPPRTRSRRWRRRAPWAARSAGRRARSWHERRERPAADGRAGGGERRERGHDQALPARGAAARAGEDLAQHVLVPARVRRADPADQAAPGGALHAAQGDQERARRGSRRAPARSWSSRTGSSSARCSERGSATSAAEVQAPLRHARRRCSTASTEIGMLTPNCARLLAARRAGDRGDQPLPRRRLRRADRLHGLRHAALQARARGAGEGGGPGGAGAPRRRARARPRGRPDRERARSRCATSSRRCTRSCWWRS